MISRVLVKPTGKVMEGWQRMEGRFTVPAQFDRVFVRFKKGREAAYFDDIRMFPATGSLKSFVYGWQHLKLQAVLDENNYATFYLYDEEGKLLKKRRETAEGFQILEDWDAIPLSKE